MVRDPKSYRLLPRGGCHSKVPASLLMKLVPRAFELAGVKQSFRMFDDAVSIASYGADGGELLVSTEISSPLLNDLKLSGKIATLHALNDLFACQARPIAAVVNLCIDTREPLAEAFTSIMTGIISTLDFESTKLAGGHSIFGAETLIGLSVFGQRTNFYKSSDVQPGDYVFLSKKISIGSIEEYYCPGMIPISAFDASIQLLLESGRPALNVGSMAGYRTMTDVTGWGLLGALASVLPSGLGAKIDVRAVPTVCVFRDLFLSIDADFRLKGPLKDNFNYVGEKTNFLSNMDIVDFAHLLNPQTNGGMLVICSGDKSSIDLEGLGYTKIGRVTDRASLELIKSG